MRRVELISHILQELRYLNVSPYSDQWEQVSNQIDIVVRELMMTGEFNNLIIRITNPERETNQGVLENFIKYKYVYRMPANFGSLETRVDDWFLGYYKNSYYLCANDCSVHSFEYQMKPDFEDFSWCDVLMLNIIIKEVASRMEAMFSGSYAQYAMKKNNELIQKAKRVKTNRINVKIGKRKW